MECHCLVTLIDLDFERITHRAGFSALAELLVYFGNIITCAP